MITTAIRRKSNNIDFPQKCCVGQNTSVRRSCDETASLGAFCLLRRSPKHRRNSSRFPAWRFKVPDEEIVFVDIFQGEQRWNVWKQHGDFVLARPPEGVGYQLAVIVDDIAMGITEVIRGYDLLDCTPWQILLYRELAPDHPLPEFGHVPLIADAAGNRLAKRNGAATIAAQLDSDTPPQKIIGSLAARARWIPAGTQLTPAELLKYYKPETLKK